MTLAVWMLSATYRAICPDGQTEEYSDGLVGDMRKPAWGNVNSRRELGVLQNGFHFDRCPKFFIIQFEANVTIGLIIRLEDCKDLRTFNVFG